MTSEARRLRQRAVSDPASVAGEAETLRDLLTASSYEARRDATEAVRKGAHADPGSFRGCVPALAGVAASGDTTSIRRAACYALGYVGRVDDRAVEALAEPQRDSLHPEVRQAAAKARNSIARESPPDSGDTAVLGGGSTGTAGTVGDTEVFDGDAGGDAEETEVFDGAGDAAGDSEGTAVFGEGDGATGGSDGGTPNFCPRCGTDLRSRGEPNFCPQCGNDL